MKPALVVIAGPNGAGKSTFYKSHLAQYGLPFINADEIAAQLGIDAYRAAAVAEVRRKELVASRRSFCFETVLSDPAGEKVGFIENAVAQGYDAVLCFIGIPAASVSEERVAQRTAEGGHDVPADRLKSRFPRVLENLRRGIERLPNVRVFDNGDLLRPYRLVAIFENGRCIERHKPIPDWLRKAARGLL